MRPLLVAALAVCLTACVNVSWGDGEPVEGSGTVDRRTVDVSGVRTVRLATPGTLVVERGAAPLRMEGDDNVLDRVEAEVEDGRLTIRAEDGYALRPSAPLRFRVGVDRLEGVAVAGTGRAEVRGTDAEAFRIDIAGSGSAEADDVASGSVRVAIAGAGDVRVAGRAAALAVEIAGSGDVDAGGLAADEAEVEIAGSGDVLLRAEKTLDVSVAGSGDVRYYGAPAISQSIAGSGDVSRAEG